MIEYVFLIWMHRHWKFECLSFRGDCGDNCAQWCHMHWSVMSALPAQGLRRAGLEVVVLVVELVVVVVSVGTTAGLSSLTLLSSSGLTAHWNTTTANQKEHVSLFSFPADWRVKLQKRNSYFKINWRYCRMNEGRMTHMFLICETN